MSPAAIIRARRVFSFAVPVSLMMVGCSEEAPTTAPPIVTTAQEAPAPVNASPRGAATEAARRSSPGVDPPLFELAITDSEMSSDVLVAARRNVYRVRLELPPGLGRDESPLVRSAAELVIDVSLDRLRATFAGEVWPVPPGSEIRLRSDLGSLYVLDHEGGRTIVSTQLAEWFDGREHPRGHPPFVAIRRDSTRTRRARLVPGSLVCAFIAAWAGEEAAVWSRRCDGGAPPHFRVGPWIAERTADVPVEIPRRELRADDVDLPPRPALGVTHAFLEGSALARIPPSEIVEGDPAVLTAVNRTDNTLIVVVQGVAVGSVAAGGTLELRGLRPGVHHVGAIAPLGNPAMYPRPVTVPGTAQFGRARPTE